MTARDKILAAFAPDGTAEIGAVASYDGIFIRDHYAALTQVPWWDRSRAAELAADFARASGLEWFAVGPCASREERARQRYEQRADGVWCIDSRTGRETHLQPPTSGGTNTECATSRHTDLDALPVTEKDIDALIPRQPDFDRNAFLAEGRHEGVVAIRGAVDLFLYSHIASPLWSLYGLLGYEGMMVFMAQDRDLALYAGRRILANTVQQIRMIAALGVDAVWIEECLTDQIRPDLFRALNEPLVRECVHEIRACGLKSIYYYCGNPHDRLDAILATGADALHFEESKKGFRIDIADIVTKVDRRCVVFGNLDAIGILEKGFDEELRAAVRRQFAAGRLNGNRFVMSTGSPITPQTSVARVRHYADLVREASASS